MDVRIEKLIQGGEGLAHHDGAALFVPYVLPGEIVAVRPLERKKKFLRGLPERVLTASAERIAPVCPHFTVCGGCQYQHISYEAQLRYKTEILRETLGRLGRIDWTSEITVHASPPWGYRNRAQWKIRPPARDPGSLPRMHPDIGYFRAGSSTLCAVGECPILSPRLAEALDLLRDALRRGALPPTLLEIEAFVNAEDSDLLLTATTTEFPASPASLAENFHSALPGLRSLLIQDIPGEQMALFGPGFLEYEANGRRLRVGHFSFFQVNRHVLSEMARAAVSEKGSGELALDLYAGVGLLTLSLARQFHRVVAVEENPAAVRDLEQNISAAGVAAKAHTASVENFLEEWREVPDLVLLDPPRAGVAKSALNRIAALAPPKISYVSCDAATLARDLEVLVHAGYVVTAVEMFDMFPQTYHTESLVRLERRA